MPVTNPELSVVTPTYNRKAELLRLLDSLDQVAAAPGEMEVIVVDDGSTDGTIEAVEQRRSRYALRLVRQQHAGPSAARNAGAQAARGTVLGFVDSDVIVQPGWWQAAKPHFQNPEVAAVEGATTPPPGSGRPAPFTHLVANTRGGSYQTCNLLCRREVFQRLRGFDGRFCVRLASGRISHCREDSDLAFSLLEQGQLISFEPKALVWHPLSAPDYGMHISMARYGLQEPLLRRKHPATYARRLKWIDGRAFPAFYWGVYAGAGLLLASRLLAIPVLAGAGGLLFLAGWGGSVYGKCRKRRTGLSDVLLLAAQFLVIPWIRLYWVLRGEWKFRNVK